MKLITLYNKQREKVGETYPRRAKQLVRSGRAVWLEEGIALQLTAEIPLSSNFKEENTVADEKICLTNDNPEAESPQPDLTGNDDFLMYLARKNVREKTNMIKNIVAFAATSLALVILHGNLAYGSHWPANQARRQLSSLDMLIRSPILQNFDAYHEELWNIQWFLESIGSMAHPIWTFIAGVMTAWGGWILIRTAVMVAGRARTKRPDPVVAEYMRLKSMAPDETAATKL